MTDDEIKAAVARTAEVTVIAWEEPRPDPAAPFRPLASLPLNAGRFNYFRIEAINPYWPDPQNAGLFEPSSESTDLAVHRWNEHHYREQFERGNRGAIGKYLRLDPDAFESSWVRAEIKRLRLARKSATLERIFTAYRTRQGKRASDSLLRNIERDQRVFALVTRWRTHYGRTRERITEKQIYIDVGSSENLSPDAVEQIAKRYRRYYKRVVPSPFSPDQFFAHLASLLARMRESVSTKRT